MRRSMTPETDNLFGISAFSCFTAPQPKRGRVLLSDICLIIFKNRLRIMYHIYQIKSRSVRNDNGEFLVQLVDITPKPYSILFRDIFL